MDSHITGFVLAVMSSLTNKKALQASTNYMTSTGLQVLSPIPPAFYTSVKAGLTQNMDGEEEMWVFPLTA